MAINTPGQKEKKAYITSEVLRTIRDNTNWKLLFQFLDLEKDEKKSKPDDWWAKSPFKDEKTASFHINDKGFFCFATQESGGVIELVQKIFLYRHGKQINCYEAGIWLSENGLSSLFPTEDAQISDTTEIRSEGEKRKGMVKDVLQAPRENTPIRQDLTPLLSLQGEHDQFKKRGISKETCQYLGCGYLEKSKSPLKERIVFQIRGIKDQNGKLQPVTLSHIGRATTKEQEEQNGKWSIYKGFLKSLELYNIDKLLTDQKAVHQAQESKRVYIVEGCFDTAKLIEAGIYNIVSTLGGHISESQLLKMQLIKDTESRENFNPRENKGRVRF
jgi:hypothetical protein